MNLARKLDDPTPRVTESPWPEHRHIRGYAVMTLPFSSGHVLGLRVFPEASLAPYASVWHRTPDGGWSIHNDGPSLGTTCPRWWGPALEHADLRSIAVSWTGANDLRVEMAEPRLEWTMRISATPVMRAANAANRSLPLAAWKLAPQRHLAEWAADRFFGLGKVRFSFVTPTGYEAVVVPEETYAIRESHAVLEGRDLGRPTCLEDTPTIGHVPLPRRPTFAVVHAFERGGRSGSGSGSAAGGPSS